MPLLQHRNRVWALVLIISSLAFIIPVEADEKEALPEDDYALMKVFVDTFEQVERNYVKEVDRRELIEAAIRGMVSKLDRHSSYISPDDFTQFNKQVDQEFGGIGIQVQFDNDERKLMVISPLPGTPAYKAGILAGDEIVEIEDKAVKEFPEGQELQSAIDLLTGKPGVAVQVGVKHPGNDEIVNVKMVRDVIHIATVLGDKYGEDNLWDYMYDAEKKIGYIRLTHFSRHSAEELDEALQELKAKGLRGLVLDLRFNPGGLLTQATMIADMFIDNGKIVSTEGRNTEPRVWNATKDGSYLGFPMAILVNGASASASEIVSACLQDHGRAVVVGERSFGKGSVQNVIELDEGSSALKLTTASYHRPSGKNIHRFDGATEDDEWGVSPDEGYAVELNPRERRDYFLYRQERDVLREGGPTASDFSDRQLDKALNYLYQELGDIPKDDAKVAVESDESKGDSEGDDTDESDSSEDKPDKADDDQAKLRLPSKSQRVVAAVGA